MNYGTDFLNVLFLSSEKSIEINKRNSKFPNCTIKL